MLDEVHASKHGKRVEDGSAGTRVDDTNLDVLSCAVQAQLDIAEQHREELEGQLAESDAAHQQLSAARRDLERQTAERDAAQQQLAAARQELHEVQQDHAAVRAELERVQLKHTEARSR